MALKVIGAGLGRNATLSMKFALEILGFGPCHHMTETFADGRRQLPLWLAAAAGKPDWDAIFDGFQSCTDYPAANFWRELADYYPDAKIVLTTRDPDAWFDSVSETIFSKQMNDDVKGTPVEAMMKGVVNDFFEGGDITDRAFMTDYYVRRNQEVMDSFPSDRIINFHPKQGWEPLCEFLGVDVPDTPFPRVNSRDEIGAAADQRREAPDSPDEAEAFGRAYIEKLRAKALAG